LQGQEQVGVNKRALQKWMVNESVCIVVALVQKAVSDHKPASAATSRLVVQKTFVILPDYLGNLLQ
jgi:hypothetical protein